jgi:hypothetical protein
LNYALLHAYGIAMEVKQPAAVDQEPAGCDKKDYLARETFVDRSL